MGDIELRAHYQNENGIGHTRFYNKPVTEFVNGDLNRLMQTAPMHLDDVHHGLLNQPVNVSMRGKGVERQVPADMLPASKGPFFLQGLRLTGGSKDMEHVKHAFRENQNLNFFTMENTVPSIMGKKMFVDLRTRDTEAKLPEAEGHDLASNVINSSNNTNPRVHVGKASAKEAKKKVFSRVDILKKTMSKSRKS